MGHSITFEKKALIKWSAVALTSLIASVLVYQIVNLFPKGKDIDILAVLSSIATVIGLFIALQQNAASAKSAQEKRFGTLEGELTEKIEKENAEQNQIITDLEDRLRTLERDFAAHQSAWSHTGSMQEIGVLRDRLYELWASTLLRTREAEIGMRLDKLEQQIKEKNNERDD
jgi:hypothetical protein